MTPFSLILACATEPMTVTTFNAGLADGYVPGARDRAPLVAKALAGLDADVVCLQEVWQRDDQVLVTDEATQLPFTDIPAALTGELDGDPACADGEIDDMLTCVQDNCGDECSDNLVDCALSSCIGPFFGLPKSCMGCVMANVGGEPEAIRDTCETESTSYAYGGSFGTALLSAHPLVSTAHEVLDSTTNRRGIQHAVVDGPNGEVDVFCTHLTAVFDLIPWPRKTGGWEEEQAAQIAAMRSYIDDNAETDTVIVMGDMNTGPGGDGLDSEVAANYRALVEGYDVPYLDDGGDCTWCQDNVLAGGVVDKAIDHVMLRGVDDDMNAERVLTEGEFGYTSCDQEMVGPLSDHYGVSVTIGG